MFQECLIWCFSFLQQDFERKQIFKSFNCKAKSPLCAYIWSLLHEQNSFTLAWIMSKADRAFWPRWEQPEFLPRAQSELGTARP